MQPKICSRGRRCGRYFARFLPLVFITLIASSAYSAECNIQDAQSALANRGFNPGPVDGVWGPATAQAVSDYQRSKSLEQTKQLDKATCSALDVKRPVAGSPTRLLTWDNMPDCRFLAARTLRNRIRVNRHATSPIKSGGAAKLATGVVHGGPYDAMGVGTEVRIDGPVEICNVVFKSGSFTVLRSGFRLAPGTQIEASQ